MSSEAWKDTGNCYECRRRGYCGAQCRKNKEACKLVLYHAAMQMRNGVELTKNAAKKGKPE